MSKPEEESEERCGFCVFMEGGGCKEAFTTIALQQCMEEHRDYYKDFIPPGAGEESTESALVGGNSRPSDNEKDASKSKQETSHEEKPAKSNSEKAASGKSKDEGKNSEDAKGKSDDNGGQKGEDQSGSNSKEGDAKKEDKSASESKQGKQEDKGGDKSEKQEDNKEDSKKASKGGNPDQQKKEGTGSKKGEGNKKADAASGDKADQESEDGGDESKGKTAAKSGTKDVAGTPAEKHAKAATETSSKQERIKDQESHPVKAKPDAEKHEKAHKETPEAEKSKSESSGDNDDSEDGTDDGGDGEEEEEEEEKPEVKVQTAPMDVRFVTTNQARHCYTRYQEYHKCAKEKGDDNPDCTFFQKAYRSICPGDWVDRWNEQREEGTFAGRY